MNHRMNVSSRRALRAAPWLVLFVQGLAAQDAPEDTTTSAPTVALHEVEEAFAAERWAFARMRTLAMLEEFEEHPALVARSAHLVSLVSECDFRAAYKEPKPKEFLAGKVKTFDRASRKLDVTYTKDSPRQSAAIKTPFAPADFITEGMRHEYSVPFAGPYEVEVQGIMPSHGAVGRQPEIIVGRAGDTYVRFSFTWPTSAGPGRKVGWWSLGSVFVAKEGVEDELTEDNTLGKKFRLMYGEPYDLRVNVNKSSAYATIHGTKYLSADKPKDLFGRITLHACPNIEKVIIKGEVDAAWLDAKFEAHRASARSTFMSEYDPAGVLPGWLLAAAADR